MLRPCPYCGMEPRISSDMNDLYTLRGNPMCRMCMHTSFVSPSRMSLVMVWNEAAVFAKRHDCAMSYEVHRRFAKQDSRQVLVEAGRIAAAAEAGNQIEDDDLADTRETAYTVDTDARESSPETL